MAISLASLRRSSTLQPPRILMHGVAGVGKSTFAAKADSPVFVMTENGLGKLEVPHFPLAASYADVSEALDSLLTESHEFRTVVIDSVDWLEPLIWAEACKRNNWSSIEYPGFGKGYVGRATVRFSDRLDVEPIWQDVRGGIIRNVSVGYAVRAYEIREEDPRHGPSTAIRLAR